MKKLRFMSVAALLTIAATAQVCRAQTAVPTSIAVAASVEPSAPAASSSKAVAEDAAKAEEEEKPSRISGEIGNALTNAYIFNGLIQDKDTIIAQPYVTLNFLLYEGEGFLNDATFTLPLWASIHDTNKPSQVSPGSSLKDLVRVRYQPGLQLHLRQELEPHDQRLHLHLAG